MFKKWLHIILSVWLINSVTYFHGSSSADLFATFHDAPVANGNEDCLKINTWTDCLGHLLADDDGASPEKAHKIKSQRRYVRGRSANDKTFLYTPNLRLNYERLQRIAALKISNYTIGVAMLPAYYNFLFRLSPF